MKPKELIALHRALQATDGQREIKTEPNGEAQVTRFVPYDLSAEAVAVFARNLVAVEQRIDELEQQQKEIVKNCTKDKEHPDGATSIAQDHPRYAQCAQALESLMDQEVQVPLYRIGLERLYRSGQSAPLPTTVMARLLSFVDTTVAPKQESK